MALSGKARDEEVIVLDKVGLTKPKTKEMATVVGNIVPDVSTAVLMLPEKNESIQRAGRNIPGFKVINILNINVLDLLNYKYLIVTQDTINKLEKKWQS